MILVFFLFFFRFLVLFWFLLFFALLFALGRVTTGWADWWGYGRWDRGLVVQCCRLNWNGWKLDLGFSMISQVLQRIPMEDIEWICSLDFKLVFFSIFPIRNPSRNRNNFEKRRLTILLASSSAAIASKSSSSALQRGFSWPFSSSTERFCRRGRIISHARSFNFFS